MKIFPHNMLPDFSQKIRNCTSKTAFMMVFCAVLIVLTIKPLFDPDFYWHLKTGFWMWDHRTLPTVDPFSIAPQVDPGNRGRFILSSYWLFQLVLCMFYKIGGFDGIIVFRCLLAAVFILVMYRFSTQRGLWAAVAAAIGTIQILDAHFPERPQFLSFICAALLLSILLGQLTERKRGLIALALPLCLTMLLWANTHGGFLLGQILLGTVLITETVKFVHPVLSPLPRRDYFNLAVSICCAILVAIINPNHIHSFEMMLPSGEANSFIYTSILEFSNMYEYFKIMKDHVPVVALCTYVFTLTIFVRSRERTDITWIGLFLLLGYMGMRHIRYYPFFLICATLFAMRYFDTEATGKRVRSVLVAFFIAVVTCSLLQMPRNLQRISSYGWVPASYFPVKVCDFAGANAITGNVFTTMDWGGYVIWRLAPAQKVFFDGRQMDPSRSWEYLNCMDVSGNPPYWKTLFDKYNIQVVILPLFDYSYRPFPLKNALEMDGGWRLISHANNGALFVRK